LRCARCECAFRCVLCAQIIRNRARYTRLKDIRARARARDVDMLCSCLFVCQPKPTRTNALLMAPLRVLAPQDMLTAGAMRVPPRAVVAMFARRYRRARCVCYAASRALCSRVPLRLVAQVLKRQRARRAVCCSARTCLFKTRCKRVAMRRARASRTARMLMPQQRSAAVLCCHRRACRASYCFRACALSIAMAAMPCPRLCALFAALFSPYAAPRRFAAYVAFAPCRARPIDRA